MDFPEVLVVRTLVSGDVVHELVPAPFAVLMVGYDELNGDEVVSARILWDDVDSRSWDMSA